VLDAAGDLSTRARCSDALNTLGSLQLALAREEEAAARSRRNTTSHGGAQPAVGSHPLLGLLPAAEEGLEAGGSRINSIGGSSAAGTSAGGAAAADDGEVAAALQAELHEAQRQLQEARDDLERDEIIFADQQRELVAVRAELERLRAAGAGAAPKPGPAADVSGRDVTSHAVGTPRSAIKLHPRAVDLTPGRSLAEADDEVVLFECDDDLLPCMEGGAGTPSASQVRPGLVLGWRGAVR
jgi:hypothetical protein